MIQRALLFLLLIIISGSCENDANEEFAKRITYISNIGDLIYSKDRLVRIGEMKLEYKVDGKLSKIIKDNRDTVVTNNFGIQEQTINVDRFILSLHHFENRKELIADTVVKLEIVTNLDNSTVISTSGGGTIDNLLYTYFLDSDNRIDSLIKHSRILQFQENLYGNSVFNYNEFNNLISNEYESLTTINHPEFGNIFGFSYCTLTYSNFGNTKNPMHLLSKEVWPYIPYLFENDFSMNLPNFKSFESEGQINIQSTSMLEYDEDFEGYPTRIREYNDSLDTEVYIRYNH